MTFKYQYQLCSLSLRRGHPLTKQANERVRHGISHGLDALLKPG